MRAYVVRLINDNTLGLPHHKIPHYIMVYNAGSLMNVRLYLINIFGCQSENVKKVS